MKLLAGKIALITGASSGIGRSAALLFAAAGAQLVLGARRAAELDSLVAEIAGAGGTAVALAGDVQEESYSQALVALALERFGGLDIAFNNAGTLGALGPTTEVPLAGWVETLQVNLTSAFLGAKHQIPAMIRRGGGSVIFTSTFVGTTYSFPGVAAYAASKSGLTGLTQTLAAEYGPQGIRVNALLPGAVDTPMFREKNPGPEAQSALAAMHALKRVAQPEELAKAALFLASDASSFVTGTNFLADGGTSIARA